MGVNSLLHTPATWSNSSHVMAGWVCSRVDLDVVAERKVFGPASSLNLHSKSLVLSCVPEFLVFSIDMHLMKQ